MNLDNNNYENMNTSIDELVKSNSALRRVRHRKIAKRKINKIKKSLFQLVDNSDDLSHQDICDLGNVAESTLKYWILKNAENHIEFHKMTIAGRQLDHVFALPDERKIICAEVKSSTKQSSYVIHKMKSLSPAVSAELSEKWPGYKIKQYNVSLAHFNEPPGRGFISVSTYIKKILGKNPMTYVSYKKIINGIANSI